MLSKKKQGAYIKKRIDYIKIQFSNFCLQQDPEAIHQLRVELKKLNALLIFINECNRSKKSIPHLKSLEKLHKKAGQIRKSQLLQSTIERYQISNVNTEIISLNNTSQLITELIDKQSFYIKEIELFEKNYKRYLVDIKNKKNQTVIKKAIKKLHHVFTKGGSENQLHSSRKKIKSLIFIQKILPQKLVFLFNFDLKYLKEIENEIGEWNDLLDFLKIAKSVYEEENPIISNTQTQIQQSLFYIYLLTFNFKESIYLKKEMNTKS